ncbi:phosphatidylethanolamine N-methyltransferase [Malassezia vespertilionis]|uniref:phosphatidylethanolamine N-methyltransferase n=1 Tax=Malassezia vespertilionis TaxID=2020962 RepID=UPI0024B12525|nr:phosphatidylethanolamine N-methyltransferase [Malassezia vespertilionis]WFD05726.1 phosphatidylethanolamine N-methyltransferase [Malassezia vespertilionis]
MLSSIFRPDLRKTPLDLLTIALLAIQVFLYLTMSRATAQVFFLVYFAFWRLSYNVGLGHVLLRQSKSSWIVRTVEKKGWMDSARCPRTSAWIRQQILTKMGRTYKYEEMPIEFNVWLLFRSIVDVILLNDFTAYFLFGISHMHGLRGGNVYIFAFRWAAGLLLIIFNIWVKLDAHRVVKDYAWYWGDCFFLSLQNMVFDGVYEVAPDPMYSIGYAGYYGLSLLSGSYTVLFVSLAAHTSQLLFLVFFEIPHMDRVYGEKKPIASRVSSKSSTDAETKEPVETNVHDLHHRLFANDSVIFSHMNLFRANDFLLVVFLLYASLPLLLYRVGSVMGLLLALINVCAWRIFHSFGLGMALDAQSRNKWIVRRFLRCHHYDDPHEAVFDAFRQWKVIYNASLIMTYISFATLLGRCYVPSGQDWFQGTRLLRHVLGVLLILLHIWSARSSYQVLGPFGWLYGDFFIDGYPKRLSYTGIYRFLNNPERSMGGAAFFGMALISGSFLVAGAAVFSHLCHWWFLSYVESPHMKRLYGREVRTDSGITKQMKQIARKNGFLFKQASKYTSAWDLNDALQRTQTQAFTTLDKLVAQSYPKVERIVDDTYAMLLQQRDRLASLRTGDEVRTIDHSRYCVFPIESSITNKQCYFLGEEIRVRWTAARNHSRRDWIGIYLVDPESSELKDTLVTRISSNGLWVGLAEDEWVGNEHKGTEAGPIGTAGVSNVNTEMDLVQGISVFVCNKLPWKVGTYELRYHHDNTHEVLARSEPFEIYVERPSDPLSFDETYAILTKIVQLALADSPKEAGQNPSADPDDLTFWSQSQVKHIAAGIYSAFDIEFSPNVVLANANVASLARATVEARKLLRYGIDTW